MSARNTLENLKAPRAPPKDAYEAPFNELTQWIELIKTMNNNSYDMSDLQKIAEELKTNFAVRVNQIKKVMIDEFVKQSQEKLIIHNESTADVRKVTVLSSFDDIKASLNAMVEILPSAPPLSARSLARPPAKGGKRKPKGKPRSHK